MAKPSKFYRQLCPGEILRTEDEVTHPRIVCWLPATPGIAVPTSSIVRRTVRLFEYNLHYRYLDKGETVVPGADLIVLPNTCGVPKGERPAQNAIKLDADGSRNLLVSYIRSLSRTPLLTDAGTTMFFNPSSSPASSSPTHSHKIYERDEIKLSSIEEVERRNAEWVKATFKPEAPKILVDIQDIDGAGL